MHVTLDLLRLVDKWFSPWFDISLDYFLYEAEKFDLGRRYMIATSFQFRTSITKLRNL
jgi:hypothetical protein